MSFGNGRVVIRWRLAGIFSGDSEKIKDKASWTQTYHLPIGTEFLGLVPVLWRLAWSARQSLASGYWPARWER